MLCFLLDRTALVRLVGGFGLGAALVLGAGSPASAGDKDKRIAVGEHAPDIELPATQIEKALPDQKDARTLHLKDLEGKKNVVLYFFPKALTGGWTIEACGFRDRAEQFARLDTVVIGISTDKLEDQQKFTDKENLNFPLLADADHQASKAFGVLMAGRPYAQRITFVIDKKGVVRKVYEVKDIKKHPDEVLAYVENNLVEKK